MCWFPLIKMFFKPIPLAFFTITVNALSSLHHQERIIGGRNASIANFPYQISLRVYGTHICGGAIIKRNVVLTAAHCIAKTNLSANFLSVRVGSTFVNSGGEIIPVSAAIAHPFFNLLNDNYDIAVIFLRVYVQYSATVQPIILPYPDLQIPENTVAVVTGWGSRARNNSVKSEVLLAAEVKVYSRKQCLQHYPYDAITESMMCAGAEDGSVDSCQGDSGGPLVANGVLIGVVSWGYSCGLPHHPGIYTNVAVVRRFIKFIAGV